jgi:hypothetical protein
VNVGNEEGVAIKIVIECDTGLGGIPTREIANFSLSASGEFKLEGFLFPQLKTIVNSRFRKVLMECGSYLLFRHTTMIRN